MSPKLDDKFPDMLELPILFKISSEKYIKDIVSGNLYMNNLKYFVDLEKISGKKGVGDVREASLFNIRKHELFLKIDGGERQKIEIGPPPGIIYDDEALFHPVFCMVGKIFLLEKTEHGEYVGKVFLEKDTIGDFANGGDIKILMIYDVMSFLKKIYETCKKNEVGGQHGFITYRDMSIPKFVDGKWVLDDTFTKDIYFENQSEFRIELFKHSEVPYILNIGDISDCCVVLNPDQIISGFEIIQRLYE